ncbi:MAG: DMT family transporter [Ignavibacteria bacterium]|nr:DMT family transporter [Ignavibacteria bacterium]
MRSSLLGYIFVVIASFFWGISATVAKIVLEKTGDPLILSQTRVTISAILLFIYLYFFKRELLKIDWKDFKYFIITGIFGLAGSNYFYYSAIKETTVSNAILVQYTAPILVALYSVFILREKLSRVLLYSIIISFIGIYLAIGGFEFNLTESSKRGIIYAVLAAFSFATFTLSAKKLLNKYQSITSMLYTLLAASLFWITVNSPMEIAAANYSTNDWLLYSVIAIISILIPYSCFFYGLKLLSSTKAILTSTLEPIFAIGSEIIFLGITFSLIQGAGAFLVIASIVILTLQNKTSNGD